MPGEPDAAGGARPPLLRSKLQAPPAPPHLVPRPRLLERLDGAWSRRLTLIRAPAGYGKTTLAASWLAGLPAPRAARCAWLSLEPRDAAPLRFWRYLGAALGTVAPGLDDVLAPPFDDDGPEVDPERVALRLLNALADRPEQLLLVLDDLHHIDHPALTEQLAFALERLPAQLHLVATSRAPLPFVRAALRARGHVDEVSAAELRFRPEESAALLGRIHAGDLPPAALDELALRTEGWAAGLYLAGLSLRGERDPLAFARGLGGHAHLIDYLTEEVLAREDDGTRAFLLETSVLERLHGELCRVVTGRDDAGARLADLAARGLFVTPLDREGRWFRYHPLFADALRRDLERSRPERPAELRRRAAEWLEREGLVDDAVRQVLAGGHVDEAVELVLRHDRSLLWQRGGRATLGPWFAALPEETIRAHPRLALDDAWLRVGFGDPERLRRRLDDVAALTEAGHPDTAALTGELEIVRAEMALARGDPDAALTHLGAADAALPAGDALLRATAAQARGYALRVRGDLVGAEAALRDAVARAAAIGAELVRVFALYDLGAVLRERGAWSEADRVWTEAARAAERGGEATASGLLAQTGRVELAAEGGRLDVARRRLDELRALRSDRSFHATETYALVVEARLLEAEGERAAADACLREAAEEVRRAGEAWRAAEIALHRARLRLRSGEVEAAAALLGSAGGLAGGGPPRLRTLRALARAELAALRGDAAGVTAALEPVAAADLEARAPLRVPVLALRAAARELAGDDEGAADLAARAVDEAVGGGYLLRLRDAAAIAPRALQLAWVRGVRPGELARALRRGGAGGDDLLTPRESEVLRLIAAGLTNREIAERLVRSEGTVRVHTSNIYGKLGVRNRTEAVAGARALGLLDDAP